MWQNIIAMRHTIDISNLIETYQILFKHKHDWIQQQKIFNICSLFEGVKHLIANGAAPKFKDNNGKTAYDHRIYTQ